MDARVLELINLELDGRLDEAGRAELDAALADDPAARARREQLRAVARELADAPAPSLPPGFRDAVLRRAPPQQRRRVNARRLWRGGLALAASIVAAALVLRVVQDEKINVADLGATLAPASATVTRVPRPGGVTLEFALPDTAADLIIEAPGEGALSAFADRTPAPIVEGRRIVVAAASGRITVQVAGNINEFKAKLVSGETVTPVTVRAP